ncbi:DUF3329 domain-containing protein [Butyrivibrio sp. VCD2006]|uniref:DUF3329 domain-containing protein n=1 Tax=Butyrivibrio sp. VCD2006 TaxID=1280664 RepID=UPI00040C7AC4|nr:DUF6056 family protein [Butyrivibrio sp. VCD2006]
MIREENTRKRLFIFSVIVCFVTIFIYETLTPMLMDDLPYSREVGRAGSFFDLFAQEYNQYMTWIGRSVAHFMLRVCMYIDMHTLGGRAFFNLIAAAVFTLLTVLVYLNIDSKMRYNVKNYALGVLLIWLFGISFGETVLWEDGACNYLFTTTIVMAMVTAFRRAYRKSISGENATGLKKTLGFFILGLISGWCNENTSGGLLLLMIILICYYRRVFVWTISAVIGCATGLAFMVLAPGNRIRMQYMEEKHEGIMAIAARSLKITLVLKEEFMVLLIALAILLIFLWVQGKRFEEMKEMLLFTFIFFTTSYCLVLTATPQDRVFFAPGIFLIVALVQGYANIDPGKEDAESIRYVILETMKLGIVAAMLIYMAFTYIECGANLARINRLMQERYSYLEEKAAEGCEDVDIPMLYPQFRNRYTAAYNCDVTDDTDGDTYWINQLLAEYYGLKTVMGVDPDIWGEEE